MKFGSLITFHDADHLTPLDDLHLLLTSVHLYTKLDSIPNQFLMLAKKSSQLSALLSGFFWSLVPDTNCLTNNFKISLELALIAAVKNNSGDMMV